MGGVDQELVRGPVDVFDGSAGPTAGLQCQGSLPDAAAECSGAPPRADARGGDAKAVVSQCLPGIDSSQALHDPVAMPDEGGGEHHARSSTRTSACVSLRASMLTPPHSGPESMPILRRNVRALPGSVSVRRRANRSARLRRADSSRNHTRSNSRARRERSAGAASSAVSWPVVMRTQNPRTVSLPAKGGRFRPFLRGACRRAIGIGSQLGCVQAKLFSESWSFLTGEAFAQRSEQVCWEGRASGHDLPEAVIRGYRLLGPLLPAGEQVSERTAAGHDRGDLHLKVERSPERFPLSLRVENGDSVRNPPEVGNVAGQQWQVMFACQGLHLFREAFEGCLCAEANDEPERRRP